MCVCVHNILELLTSKSKTIGTYHNNITLYYIQNLHYVGVCRSAKLNHTIEFYMVMLLIPCIKYTEYYILQAIQ